MTNQKRAVKRIWIRDWKRDFRTNYELYLFLLPAILLLVIFRYIPMYGVQIAFKNYKPVRGIWASDWSGLKWFIRFFNSYQCWNVITNTLILNVYLLLFSFPASIIFAMILNQYSNPYVKRTLQTISYAPHFISTVVLAGMITMFLHPSTGMYGNLCRLLGKTPALPMGDAGLFRTIYVISDIWKEMGWESIIYLAALSGVDREIYDAATVDGASRLQRIWHIELPSLRTTATLILIMRIGALMSLGFEKTYLLQNNLNIATSETIATYVYKVGLTNSPQYSYSTAIDLFSSAVNMLMLITFNSISKRLNDYSLW